MPGMKRLVAKVVAGTTLLAALSGGTYYALVHGGGARVAKFWRGNGDNATATLVTDDTHELSPADLEAVTSSWAASEEPAAAVDSEISPAARSAEVTLASSAATSAPTVGSRYAVPSDSPVPVALEPEPAVDDGLADAETEQDSAKETETAQDVEAEPTPALARGQDPVNEDATLSDVAEISEPDSLGLPTSEPKAPTSPASAEEGSTGAERARDAFRDNDASESSLGATTGGRYAPAATASAAPASSRSAQQETTVVNPFASQPMPTAAAASTEPNTTEPHDLGQSPPVAGSNQQNDLSAAFGEQPRSGAVRSARAAYSEPMRDTANSEQLRPLESASSRLNGLGSGSPSYSATGGLPSAIEGTGRPGERALEGPQKPALVIHKTAPAELQVGKLAKFMVLVQNIGSQAAEDVVLRDEVPEGTKLVSTTPTAESDGSLLIWQLGKLSAGEERTFEVQVMPTDEGEIGSVAKVTYSAQASVKARCTMPQLALRLTAPNEVMIGSEQRVKIELRNPGTGDATGVMLFENVPPNLRHAAGPALEFEVGTLRAGETRELELLLRAEKAGKVINTLSARADGNLQVQQQVEFEVIAPALSVEVNGPERRYLERPATYEVVVANPGTAVAHDVQLVTKLPKGMRFVRANNMGEYDAASHAVYWSLSELPEGERGAVELVAMPIETGPQTIEVEGRAQQGLSDQKQQQIMVEGLAAIMFEVRDLVDPIEVGGETGYEIRVVNQGTKAATNVRVAVNLPPGMKVISAEGETHHNAQGNIVTFEPLAQLAPKADTVFRLKLQGVQVGDQRVTVEVNTDDLGQPIRREESTRVFGDE